jgi:WD40 repeat protein
VDLSPDGSTLATGGMDKAARFWDVATARPIAPSLRHDDAVTDVSFSPDGRCILTAGWDGKAKLWNLPQHDLNADPSRIRLWVETLTALEVDGQESTRVLDASVWNERRQELDSMGGPPKLLTR